MSHTHSATDDVMTGCSEAESHTGSMSGCGGVELFVKVKMRKESKVPQTPSLTDGPPTDHSEAERFVNIPVAYPFGALSFHNTVQIKVSLDNPPAYDELIEKILVASESLFRPCSVWDLDAAKCKLKELLSEDWTVLFAWDFAPSSQSYSGTSAASSLTSEELVECYHAAHAGRISYIFINIVHDDIRDILWRVGHRLG